MNCPHGKRQAATCLDCISEAADRIDERDARAIFGIVLHLARCAHETPVTIHGTTEWCPACGAVRGIGSAGWLEPGSWVRAKELDGRRSLEGWYPDAAKEPPLPKNVIPMKPRT